MKRILHVTQVFLPYLGGSTIRLLNLLKPLRKNAGFELHVLTTLKNVSPESPPFEIIDGIFVHRAPTFRDMPKAIKKIRKQYSFDLLHVHNPRPFWYSAPFLWGIPKIIELHSLQSLSWYKEMLGHGSYRFCERVLVISDCAQDYVRRVYKLKREKVSVIKNGIDSSIFSKDIAVPKDYKTEFSPKIGYIGSFYKWQGIFELLESVPYVLKRLPNAVFFFIGDGPEKDYLIKRSREISSERIRVLPQIRQDQVPACIAGLDLFCMLRPSSRATTLTLPLKVYEVGMTKTPLLVTRLPGLLEAGGHEPENYFSVTEDATPEGVGSLITELLSKSAYPVIKEKAERFYDYLLRQDLSWVKQAEKLSFIYQELIQENK
jgi:glycosyltransferase involved in cell wall biosynthesis